MNADGELYRVAGRWVVRDGLAQMTGEPTTIINERTALEWLLANGYAPPIKLAEYARCCRLL